MANTTDLILLPFNVGSAQDIPLCQLQQLRIMHVIYLPLSSLVTHFFPYYHIGVDFLVVHTLSSTFKMDNFRSHWIDCKGPS